MKFLPGDTYIFDSRDTGNQKIMIRSDENAWVQVPKHPVSIFDGDMNTHLSTPGAIRLDRSVFVRHGVNILPDIVLGYGDNIQFGR